MKLLCLLVACFYIAQAQAQFLLSGKIKNASPGTRVVVNVPLDAWYHKANSVEVKPDEHGNFSAHLPVTKPQTIFLDFNGHRIYLYAEPNASLRLTFDDKGFPAKINFGGSLKKENNYRQEIGLLRYELGMKSYNDTLTAPEQIIASIAQNQKDALQRLDRQKRSFTSGFYQMTESDLNYFVAGKFWRLVFANKVWSVKNKSKVNREEWRKSLVALYAALPVSNANAVPSYFYQEMVAYYPRYLELSAATEDEFAKVVEVIMKKPFAEARKEIKEKGRRFWEHKAWVYGLHGAALENALASFLNNGIYNGELGYQKEAFEDFLARFPNSAHLPYLSQLMQRYQKSQATGAASAIELVPTNYHFKNLEEIAQAHKGKVVYVDVWGSWCGPCREEFAYSSALKDRFKDKGVDFLYIAFEHSATPEKIWQETIRFYGLGGKHILGNKLLEQYFLDLYAQTNSKLIFPSYLLINKEGKIVTMQAARPSDNETLCKQIEPLL